VPQNGQHNSLRPLSLTDQSVTSYALIYRVDGCPTFSRMDFEIPRISPLSIWTFPRRVVNNYIILKW